MTDFEVIALFTPADGRADAVHAALAGLVAPSRAEPANRGYTIRRISATPPRYAVRSSAIATGPGSRPTALSRT